MVSHPGNDLLSHWTERGMACSCSFANVVALFCSLFVSLLLSLPSFVFRPCLSFPLSLSGPSIPPVAFAMCLRSSLLTLRTANAFTSTKYFMNWSSRPWEVNTQFTPARNSICTRSRTISASLRNAKKNKMVRGKERERRRSHVKTREDKDKNDKKRRAFNKDENHEDEPEMRMMAISKHNLPPYFATSITYHRWLTVFVFLPAWLGRW